MDQNHPELAAIARSYDAKFARQELQESARYYRWILRCLEPQPYSRLLDVSCGAGHLLGAAAECQIRAAGIDISRVALQMARCNAQKAPTSQANGMALPFAPNSFDYVTNLGSLEHYSDIPLGIKEMARVLKPGGRLAIFVPNSYYLVDIVWMVMRTGYGPSHKQLLERFATAGEWRDTLTANGVRVERTHAYNFCFPRTAEDLRWYRRSPRKILNLCVAPIVPFNLAYHFLFIGTKA